MLFVGICSVVIGISCAASLSEDARATITRYYDTNDGKGNYEFSFETSNGIRREEFGTLVNVGQADEHIEVQGEVSYTGPDGKPVVIRYKAGEDGYQILPPLPPLPPLGTRVFSSPNVVATLLGK